MSAKEERVEVEIKELILIYQKLMSKTTKSWIL